MTGGQPHTKRDVGGQAAKDRKPKDTPAKAPNPTGSKPAKKIAKGA